MALHRVGETEPPATARAAAAAASTEPVLVYACAPARASKNRVRSAWLLTRAAPVLVRPDVPRSYEGAKNKIVSTLKMASIANLGFAVASAPILQYITAASGNSGKGIAMSGLLLFFAFGFALN